MNETGKGQEADTDGLERERLSMERERLKLERQKLAVEIRLKRKELAAQKGKGWLELLVNPLTLLIVGGFVSLMTTIVTSYWTQRSNAATEQLRAKLAQESAEQQLQADLIKKFVEAPEIVAVRDNLTFLVKIGLVPRYADKMKAYLETTNPLSGPQVAPPQAQVAQTQVSPAEVAPPQRPGPLIGGGDWLVVAGVFYASTERSRPEALAKETAELLELKGKQNAVQILRGVLGDKERNIIVVKASSQEEAQDLRNLLRSAGGDLSEAVAMQNRGWKDAADCAPTGCIWKS